MPMTDDEIRQAFAQGKGNPVVGAFTAVLDRDILTYAESIADLAMTGSNEILRSHAGGLDTLFSLRKRLTELAQPETHQNQHQNPAS